MTKKTYVLSNYDLRDDWENVEEGAAVDGAVYHTLTLLGAVEMYVRDCLIDLTDFYFHTTKTIEVFVWDEDNKESRRFEVEVEVEYNIRPKEM